MQNIDGVRLSINSDMSDRLKRNLNLFVYRNAFDLLPELHRYTQVLPAEEQRIVPARARDSMCGSLNGAFRWLMEDAGYTFRGGVWS